MNENPDLSVDDGCGVIDVETRRERSIALDTLEAVEASIGGASMQYRVDEENIQLLFALTLPEEPAHDSLGDDIVAEYNRTHEEHGWTWRSPESLSEAIDESEEDIREWLDGSDLFQISSNERKYRYTDLPTE